MHKTDIDFKGKTYLTMKYPKYTFYSTHSQTMGPLLRFLIGEIDIDNILLYPFTPEPNSMLTIMF
jgi:hypothetical protein